ncbi:MAG TPA: hypothetical protein VGQ83_34805 [Polyangia bacterium]
MRPRVASAAQRQHRAQTPTALVGGQLAGPADLIVAHGIGAR